jgi:hypothetical protein
MPTAERDPGKPRIELVELGALKKWPKNPKSHDLGFLGEAFAANGLAEFPTIDEGTGRMVAGHGRVKKLEVMLRDGEKPPARVVVKGGKWFVPVIRGMTFADPAKHVVASNRGVELGGWETSLAGFLKDIGIKNLAGTGFTEDNYASFLKGASAPDQFPDVSDNLETEHECPRCSYRWSGSTAPRAKEEPAPVAEKKKRGGKRGVVAKRAVADA